MSVKEKYIADSLEIESERVEYQKLLDEKNKVEAKIKSLREEQKIKLGYSIDKYKK